MMLAMSCEVPRTEIVARIESEVAWGSGEALQSLAISVRRVGPDGPLRSARVTALGTETGRAQLPFAVGLIAADDEVDDPVWIEVLGCPGPNGCEPTTARVMQRAVVRFTRGRTEELPLLLASACLDVRCASNERCNVDMGRCELATRAQEMLQPLGSVDAAVASDRPMVNDRPVAMDVGPTDSGQTDAPVDVAAMDRVATIDRPAVMDVPVDAGVRDVPPVDLGVVDVGARDVPPVDVGSPDTGGRDVPPVDVGSPDSGMRDVPPVDAGTPCVSPRVTCGGACVDLMSDTTHCGACGAGCRAGGWCAAGRCYAGERYAVTQPSTVAVPYLDVCGEPGAVRVLMSSDDESVSMPLPFATRWWGAPLASGATMVVAVNGAISVGGTSGLFPVYQAIPDTRVPNGVIAVHWADLFNTAGGTCVAAVGAAPTRRWVVQWVNTAIRGVTSNLSFEVIVHEGSGVIEFAYGSLSDSGAAIGLENPTGTEVASGCIGTTIPCEVTSNARLRFTPAE